MSAQLPGWPPRQLPQAPAPEPFAARISFRQRALISALTGAICIGLCVLGTVLGTHS